MRHAVRELERQPQKSSAYVSIRQHTSAYVSIRQHTSAYVSIRQHTSAYVSIRQHATRARGCLSIALTYDCVTLTDAIKHTHNVCAHTRASIHTQRLLHAYTRIQAHVYTQSTTEALTRIHTCMYTEASAKALGFDSVPALAHHLEHISTLDAEDVAKTSSAI